MKAVVLIEKQKMVIKEVPHPKLEEHEVLVKVKASGICGTDQHIYHGQPGSAAVQPPIILGHELSGEVVQIGKQVKDLKLGDRVSIDPNIYCGKCEYCRGNRPHLCNSLHAIGVTRDGGMGQYCSVPASNCYKIPDSLSFEEGAMVEPLGCVLHGFKQINVWPGASILIIGGGYIGLMMLQMAKIYGGSKIVVSEPDQSKHDLAKELGADFTITPSNTTEGEGFDIVIECVGKQESMSQAVNMARKGGQVLLFGVSDPGTTIEVSPFEIFSKELTIKGSFINPYTHEQAISLIEQGKVEINPLISHYFNLEDMPNVMNEYKRLNVIKGVINNFD